MNERRLSDFLGQAVNGKLSFETLLTLLNIATERDCRMVRYLMPPPQEFGAFLEEPKDFKPFDFSAMGYKKPEELSLNELCEAALIVIKRIHLVDNARHAAEVRADNAERDARQWKEAAESLQLRLDLYEPRQYADDDDGYLP